VTSLRAHLDEGYAELLDSFGNVAAEWHDKGYAKAIQDGECTVERWHQILRDLAVERGYLIKRADGTWYAANMGENPRLQSIGNMSEHNMPNEALALKEDVSPWSRRIPEPVHWWGPRIGALFVMGGIAVWALGVSLGLQVVGWTALAVALFFVFLIGFYFIKNLLVLSRHALWKFVKGFVKWTAILTAAGLGAVVAYSGLSAIPALVWEIAGGVLVAFVLKKVFRL
jgi:hypothetical protein